MCEKICKECDYFRNRWAQYFVTLECVHPSAARRVGDVVTGFWKKFMSCDAMRAKDGTCGPEGKLWEPRRSAIERWLTFR